VTAGYTCPGCGDLIEWDTSHACSRWQAAIAPQPKPEPLERIAAALERIADYLKPAKCP
jgi:hypothetical protein